MRGYVTITTSDGPWPELAAVLGESMGRFSAYPLRVESVPAIDGPAQRLWCEKVRAMLRCPWDRGIYLDADCVATKNVDDLWDEAAGWEPLVYPLCPLHPSSAQAAASVPPEVLRFVGAGPDVTVTRYRHASIVAFSAATRPFLKEWLAQCERAFAAGIALPLGDETILNALLARDGATGFMPVCDPHYGAFGRPEWADAACVWHGCKDPDEAEGMLIPA